MPTAALILKRSPLSDSVGRSPLWTRGSLTSSSGEPDGKVFISHSSDDKPFVRKLADALRNAGFEPWLDERELIVGDPLAAKIAAALERAGALIVVVSEASAKSNWLGYELNIVADKLVSGDIRVIPVVIGDPMSMPAELKGRLYADFRKSFKSGFELVERALDQEERVTRHGWKARSNELEALLEGVFGPRGWTSGGSEFMSVDFDHVSLPPTEEEPEGRDVAYELVLDYGWRRPIDPHDFESWLEKIGPWAMPRAMLISERPLAFLNEERFAAVDGVGWLRVGDEQGWTHMTDTVVVAVDLTDTDDTDERRARLLRARQLFETELPSGPSFVSKLLEEKRQSQP
jgi:hypothetical protein